MPDDVGAPVGMRGGAMGPIASGNGVDRMGDVVLAAGRSATPGRDRVTIGERIEAVRAKNALPQHELAELLTARGSDLSRDDLRLIELGVREASEDELAAIADVLGVEPGYLADVDGERPSGPDVPSGTWMNAREGCWYVRSDDGATQAAVVHMPNGYLWSVADAYLWVGIACGITPTYSQAVDRCDRILFGN